MVLLDKNANINSGTPFKIYADMTTDGGGWTLLLKIPLIPFGLMQIQLHIILLFHLYQIVTLQVPQRLVIQL